MQSLDPHHEPAAAIRPLCVRSSFMTPEDRFLNTGERTRWPPRIEDPQAPTGARRAPRPQQARFPSEDHHARRARR